MFFYLQTLGEFTGHYVTDRYILPCLDKILDIVGEGHEISVIVINMSTITQNKLERRIITQSELCPPWEMRTQKCGTAISSLNQADKDLIEGVQSSEQKNMSKLNT